MKKNTKKQVLNISIVLLLAVITLIALLSSSKELNYSNIKTFFSNANPLYIIIAFACWIGFIAFEAISLHIILKVLGYKPKIKSSIAYSTSDTYYSAITPSASGGQPASAYYMIKDGISGGTAGFSLIFNLIGYTAAILIIGTFALIIGFDTFLKLPGFVKFLVIFGYITQIGLLIFFIACMKYHVIVKKFGNFTVRLLNKIKLIKNKEKWLDRVNNTVDKYKNSYEGLKKHKMAFIPVILFNVAQRTSQILISVFVCMSAIDCSFIEMLVMQSFVVLGYNSLPLPGGSGAFEYLYMKIYTLSLPESYIIVAMMVTRIISYYFSMVASGAYTLIYHLLHPKIKKGNDEVVTTSSN